jgi:non-ribosomal peptide synthase protein (TIGR01720 family)
MLIEQVIKRLLAHHDELRAYFVHDDSGWQKFIAEPDGWMPFICVDLADLETRDQDRAIQATSNGLNLSLDLSTPPLFQVAFFYLGDDRPARLVIIVHHLIRDAISQKIRLPLKTTSVKEYVERLQAYARSMEMRRELDNYWLKLPWAHIVPLPMDYPENEARRTMKSIDHVPVALSAEETHVLQTEVPRAYHAQVIEALLMAVVQAITRWTGRQYQLISWVRDGRVYAIPGADDLDPSRTVGWLGFSSYLMLERVATQDPAESLRAIQEQLGRIPNRGLGFDILHRYGDTEAMEKAKSLFKVNTIVQVIYQGVLDQSVDGPRVMQPASEPAPMSWDPQSKDFHHPLLLRGEIVNGCFNARWEYNQSVHKRATIERIANDFMEAMRALVIHCRSQELA